jgi:hypothetical protein
MVCIVESFNASVWSLAVLVNLWQIRTAQIWALGLSSFDSGRLLTIYFPEVAFPQGLKPIYFVGFMARLKSCPDTEPQGFRHAIRAARANLAFILRVSIRPWIKKLDRNAANVAKVSSNQRQIVQHGGCCQQRIDDWPWPLAGPLSP